MTTSAHTHHLGCTSLVGRDCIDMLAGVLSDGVGLLVVGPSAVVMVPVLYNVSAPGPDPGRRAPAGSGTGDGRGSRPPGLPFQCVNALGHGLAFAALGDHLAPAVRQHVDRDVNCNVWHRRSQPHH